MLTHNRHFLNSCTPITGGEYTWKIIRSTIDVHTLPAFFEFMQTNLFEHIQKNKNQFDEDKIRLMAYESL